MWRHQPAKGRTWKNYKQSSDFTDSPGRFQRFCHDFGHEMFEVCSPWECWALFFVTLLGHVASRPPQEHQRRLEKKPLVRSLKRTVQNMKIQIYIYTYIYLLHVTVFIYITIYTYLQTPVTSEGNLGHKHDNWQLTSDSKTYLSDFRGEEKNIKKKKPLHESFNGPAWTCDILRHPPGPLTVPTWRQR